MRTHPSLLVVAIAVVACFSSCRSAPSERASARDGDAGAWIALGDRVHIVSSEPAALTGTYVVDTDGTIALPQLGSIGVAGLVGPEIEALLAEKLGEQPGEHSALRVRVERAPAQYSVLGAVARTGAQAHTGDLTLFEAVMSAQPDAATADLSRVRLVRCVGAAPGAPFDQVMDLRPILERGDSSMNVHIEPGDVIVVPAHAPSEQTR